MAKPKEQPKAPVKQPEAKKPVTNKESLAPVFLLTFTQPFFSIANLLNLKHLSLFGEKIIACEASQHAKHFRFVVYHPYWFISLRVQGSAE